MNLRPFGPEFYLPLVSQSSLVRLNRAVTGFVRMGKSRRLGNLRGRRPNAWYRRSWNNRFVIPRRFSCMLVDVAADGIHHMTADRAMNVVATIRSLAVGCPGVGPIVVQYDLSQIQFVGLCHSLFVRGEEHRNFFSAISIAINQRMILVFRHAVSHYRIGLSSRSRYLSFQNSIASS